MINLILKRPEGFIVILYVWRLIRTNSQGVYSKEVEKYRLSSLYCGVAMSQRVFVVRCPVLTCLPSLCLLLSLLFQLPACTQMFNLIRLKLVDCIVHVMPSCHGMAINPRGQGEVIFGRPLPQNSITRIESFKSFNVRTIKMLNIVAWVNLHL